METVDRLRSEKEDLEQEMRDLSQRNEELRANNEVPASSLGGGQDLEGSDESGVELVPILLFRLINLQQMSEIQLSLYFGHQFAFGFQTPYGSKCPKTGDTSILVGFNINNITYAIK